MVLLLEVDYPEVVAEVGVVEGPEVVGEVGAEEELLEELSMLELSCTMERFSVPPVSEVMYRPDSKGKCKKNYNPPHQILNLL